MSDFVHEDYTDQYGRPCLRIRTETDPGQVPAFRIEAVLERDGEVAVYEHTLCILSFDHNYPAGAAKTLAVIAARQYLKEDA